jgi:hypothetical protein
MVWNLQVVLEMNEPFKGKHYDKGGPGAGPPAGFHRKEWSVYERHYSGEVKITSVNNAYREAGRGLDVFGDLQVGDLFQASDIEPLPGLHRVHEIGRLQKPLAGPGIEPCQAAAEQLHM